MFDEEKLIKKLQKIPRSKSLETRKQGVTGKLTQEEAKQWFRYKDGKLYWGKSPSKKINIGDEAGYIYRKTLKIVKLKKQTYLVAKLIFLIHHGYYPKNIYYVDKNSLNINLLNLRASNEFIKNYTQLGGHSSTGFKGIHFVKRLNKYYVRIFSDYKHYSIGCYINIEDAKKAYNLAAKRIYGEFAVLHDLTKEE